MNAGVPPPLDRRGQAGFAVAAGLVVWFAVCSATLVALLDLSMAASRASIVESTRHRQVRAADAALEAAITRARMDPEGRIGASGGPDGACEEHPTGDGAPLEYRAVDGTVVRVTATCEPSTRRMAVPGTGRDRFASLDLLGPRYRSAFLPGSVDWRTDCAEVAFARSCYPWRLSLGGPNYAARVGEIDATEPSLVHTADASVRGADATLTVAGDLNVAGSAVPLVGASSDPGSAAITVAGAFRQGDKGLFADVGGSPCGILGPGFPWNVVGARIVDSDEPRGAPSCGERPPIAADGLPAPTTWPLVAPVRTVPACPAGAGSVIALEPGAYPASATRRLNDLMGGGCPGRTVWFRPGDYWIDVDDPTNPPGQANALLVDDPSIRVIMGTPRSGRDEKAAAVATFPQACDPSSDGVSITLSPRTSLRHQRGRLAACDRTSSTASASTPPVLWQAPAADAGWVGRPSPVASTITATKNGSQIPLGVSVVDPAEAWVVDGRFASASAGCGAEQRGACGAAITLSARGIGSGSEPLDPLLAGTPVRSLDVNLRLGVPAEDAGNQGGRTVAELLLYRSGAVTPTCAISVDWAPPLGAARTLSFDLFSSRAAAVTGIQRCADVRASTGLTRAELRGARIDVVLRTGSVTVDGVEVVAGWSLSPAAAVNVAGWADAHEAVVADGRYADLASPCRTNCQAFAASFTAGGFDNPTDPWVPVDGPLVRAALVVTGEPPGPGAVSTVPAVGSSTLTASLQLPDGATCRATWPLTSLDGQGVLFDLLAGDGDCRKVLTSTSQLVGAAVTLRVDVAAGSTAPTVRIDSLRLVAVGSGRYTGPTSPNLFTQDAAGGPAPTSAVLAGSLSMPRATLDVRWSGRPPTTEDGGDLPVISGSAVLEALGSSVGPGGVAGVVCCAPSRPAERVMVLRASVPRSDGSDQLIATARVRIIDVGGVGSAVRVEDWSTV